MPGAPRELSLGGKGPLKPELIWQHIQDKTSLLLPILCRTLFGTETYMSKGIGILLNNLGSIAEKNTSAWQNFLYSGSRNRLISCVQFFQFHDFWVTKVSNYQTATLSSPSWVYTAEQLFWCIWNVEWNKWPTKLYSNILLWRGNWVAVILDGKVWPSPHKTRPNSSASPFPSKDKNWLSKSQRINWVV